MLFISPKCPSFYRNPGYSINLNKRVKCIFTNQDNLMALQIKMAFRLNHFLVLLNCPYGMINEINGTLLSSTQFNQNHCIRFLNDRLWHVQSHLKNQLILTSFSYLRSSVWPIPSNIVSINEELSFTPSSRVKERVSKLASGELPYKDAGGRGRG